MGVVHQVGPGNVAEEPLMLHSGHVAFHDSLQPLMVDINSVERHPENYNNGDVEAVAESIEVNGMYRPIYVQKSTNQIIAGNHTWEACKAMEADMIPVVYLDVDDTEALQIMVADNEVARLAMPDNAALLATLRRIEEQKGDVHGTGKTERDMEALQHLADIANEYDEYAQWPTITIQVPPNVRRAYLHMTKEADDDRERFELLLRFAGWDGK